MMLRLLLAGLLLATGLTAQADEAADKILNCMRANIPDALRIQEVELNATDRTGGTRTLKGRVYAYKDKGLVRATLRINAPSDLSGAAYLMRETDSARADDIFFYLPAVGRVRRISGTSADASLLGTDFSYNDMKEIQSAFGGSVPKLGKDDVIEQRSMSVLTLTPAAASSRYSQITAWIDQKTCLAMKVQFMEAGVLRKELTAPASAIGRSGNFWYVSEARMRDAKEGTSTIMKIVGITEGGDLPSRLFDPHSFYLGG